MNSTYAIFFSLFTFSTEIGNGIKETSKVFHIFLNRIERLSSDWFQGVHIKKIPVIEGLLKINLFLNDTKNLYENNIENLPRGSFQYTRKTFGQLGGIFVNNNVFELTDVRLVNQFIPIKLADYQLLVDFFSQRINKSFFRFEGNEQLSNQRFFHNEWVGNFDE